MTSLTVDFKKNIFKIAHEAGNILLHHFNTYLDVSYKQDAFDPVTIADKEADHFIRSAIQNMFSHDCIISEEHLVEGKNVNQERTWFIDPLDGTKDYIQGRDCFSINIGLLDKGIPVFGCVYIPARNQLFYAERGHGAFEYKNNNDYQISVSAITNVTDARLITRYASGEVRPIETILDTLPFKDRIPEGSIGTKLCLVASGQAETHINTNFKASKWDTLASGLILSEAGGIITDFDGQELDYLQPSLTWKRSFIGSNNSIIHNAIIQELHPLINEKIIT